MTHGTRERITALLTDPSTEPDVRDGYLDLLGPAATRPPTLAQSVMRSSLLPVIYERVWRPIGFNVAKGWPAGPDTAAEHRLARRRLGLGRPGGDRPDAVVLDVACGPGNVTRSLARGVGGGGLVVGTDAAPGMLARAVTDTDAENVGYVRADVAALPFTDASFDAVCCFGALYLFDDPWAALDEMTRVLRPGGRIAILTTRRPRVPLAGLPLAVASELTGVRLFGDNEVARALDARGYTALHHDRYPLMQLVAARRVE